MGFADTGASRLRNNRKLLRSKRGMSDKHLNVRKYYRDKPAKGKIRDKDEISKDKVKKIKLELKNEKKLKNRKMVILLISLTVIAIMIGLLFFTDIK